MEFSLHNDFSDLAPLASDWNMLLAESITHIPFLRYEYLSAWWATRGGGEWPESELAVVTAHQDGRLAGIAPLFSARNHDGKPALLLLGSIEISDYLDIIVRPADLSIFLAGLLDFISRPGLPGLAPARLAQPARNLAYTSGLEGGSWKAWLDFQPGSDIPCSFHPIDGRFRDLSRRY